MKQWDHSRNREDCCHFYHVGMWKAYIPHFHAFPFPLTGSWLQWNVPVGGSALCGGATPSRCTNSELPASKQIPWTGLCNRQGTRRDNRALKWWRLCAYKPKTLWGWISWWFLDEYLLKSRTVLAISQRPYPFHSSSEAMPVSQESELAYHTALCWAWTSVKQGTAFPVLLYYP